MLSPQPCSSLAGWIYHSCQSRLVLKRLSELRHRRWAATEAPPKQARSEDRRKPRLPQTPARTRFAPSPTGHLHLGSIRTALFNYLLARRTKGQFLLRIEDTDQKRTVSGAEEQLYKDLRWAGLEWDEGPTVGGEYGPYKQSERSDLYRTEIAQLLHTGKAYRCFCGAARLDQLNRSRHSRGLPLGYDRRCLQQSRSQAEGRAHKGEKHVVRFQVPEKYPKFYDLVYGETGQGDVRVRKLLVDEPVYDDPVLMKSDGLPTYHFANVVDDHLMNVTHVIRGSEWMASTPLHVALYDAFRWEPPAFAHVPLLVDREGQKLSKRNFNSDIYTFQKQGILPHALVNFAALLGWSHLKKNDTMDLKELEEQFNLKITKGNTVVAFEKLNFLQEQHARRKIAAHGEEFEQMIRDVASALLARHGAAEMLHFIRGRRLRDVVASMISSESLPYRSPVQFATSCDVFIEKPDPQIPLKTSDTSFLKSLRTAAAILTLIPEDKWQHEHIRTSMEHIEPDNNGTHLSNQEWRREYYHYLRWGLLGGATGPNLPRTMEVLGKYTCTERIHSAALTSRDMEIEGTRPVLQPEIASQ